MLVPIEVCWADDFNDGSRRCTALCRCHGQLSVVSSRSRGVMQHTPGWRWTLLVVAGSLPFAVILSLTLWDSPYPLSEAVALFEDVADRPASSFLVPSSSYYRPLFHLTLSALWHGAPSIAAALDAIKICLHIAPVMILIVLFGACLRPHTAVDAAAATVAVAVLVGSAGTLGNLELPLSYTIVGMPIAVFVWMLLERQPRPWHGPAIVVLLLVALGFKEQGLVIAPVIIVAWWMGAPSASRGTAIAVAAITAAYVTFRLGYRPGSLPMFEQQIGVGFDSLSPAEAEARFGGFPLWIYAYNAGSTVANVLFAEPAEGVFRIVRAVMQGRTQPWHVQYLLSSAGLTGLNTWWGTGAVRRSTTAWSAESRVFAATAVALAACGILSFNYSRDRLGGMAIPFYALAAYWAVRAGAWRAVQAPRRTAVVATVLLMALATAWQCRAIYTIEFTRQRAVNAQREWLTDVGERRRRFADRPTYLRIMEEMVAQGVRPRHLQRTQYPRWMIRGLGEYCRRDEPTNTAPVDCGAHRRTGDHQRARAHRRRMLSIDRSCIAAVWRSSCRVDGGGNHRPSWRRAGLRIHPCRTRPERSDCCRGS